MRKAIVLLLAAALAGSAAGTARAHGVEYSVVPADGVRVVEIHTADGRPFSYESYEITGPGDQSPFQVGRTDRLGRVAFAPDRTGEWSIRAWSEDGHGITVRLEVEDLVSSTAPAAAVGSSRRVTGTIVGVVLILVVGGVMYFQKRKEQS